MKLTIKKTATAAMLVALTVAMSGFSIPIGASRCYPIQHLVNVVCAVFLGPVYGVMAAFCTSFIRNLMGTGLLGGMLCYPVAVLIMGNSEAALFTYVMPFFMSTACGTVMAAILVAALEKSHAMNYLKGVLES